MRFLQADCLGAYFGDRDKIRVRLRNVPLPTVDGVVDRKGIFVGRGIVEAKQAEVLPNRLRTVAEVARGSAGLAVGSARAVDQEQVTVGRRPERIDEWQYARLQICNGTPARSGSRRRQALARAVIWHNSDLA